LISGTESRLYVGVDLHVVFYSKVSNREKSYSCKVCDKERNPNPFYAKHKQFCW